MEGLLYLLVATSLGALAMGRRTAGMRLLAIGTGLLAIFAMLVGFSGLLPSLTY